MSEGKFSKWIADSGGPNAVAAKLGVTGAAVRVWLRGEYAPQIPTMLKIVKLSKGRLTLDDIIKESRRNFDS